MLTTGEAAEILGVKQSSIRVWLSEDGHPRFPNARRFGHVWQIPESDLAGLPRERKRGRPPKAGTSDSDQAEQTLADEAPAVEPKPRASKKSTAKKASKTTRSKKPMKKRAAKR